MSWPTACCGVAYALPRDEGEAALNDAAKTRACEEWDVQEIQQLEREEEELLQNLEETQVVSLFEACVSSMSFCL